MRARNASHQTKIVYCRDSNRRERYPNVSFDFLGYCFRPRTVKSRHGNVFCSFAPAVSPSALKAMRETIRDLNVRRRTDVSMVTIARKLNPILRGWMGYYGRYTPSALTPIYRYINQTVQAWMMHKFKRFKGHKTRASQFLERIARTQTGLFVHWRGGMGDAFA